MVDGGCKGESQVRQESIFQRRIYGCRVSGAGTAFWARVAASRASPAAEGWEKQREDVGLPDSGPKWNAAPTTENKAEDRIEDERRTRGTSFEASGKGSTAVRR